LIENGTVMKKELSDVNIAVIAPLVNQSSTNVPPGFQQHHLSKSSVTTNSILSNTLQTNGGTRKPPFDNSMSLFSNTGFSGNRNIRPVVNQNPVIENIPVSEIPDTIPVSSTTDWQAAFGFSSTILPNVPTSVPSEKPRLNDDDLGFDPWDESSKALADLIEQEGVNHYNFSQRQLNNVSLNINFARVDNKQSNHGLPPGFFSTQVNNNVPHPQMGFHQSSKMLGLMHYPPSIQNYQKPYHDSPPDASYNRSDHFNQSIHSSYNQNDVLNMKEMQDGLRAMLPNINISFGAPPHGNSNKSSSNTVTQRSWTPDDISWDPAILTSGAVTDRKTVEEPPHWMESLHHLTEDNTNYHMPYFQQIPYSGHQNWTVQQAQNPPPGFHQPRYPIQIPEPQKLADGLQ